MSILTNTVIHADCLKAMPMLPNRSVDFILTDPPYLVNYKSRDGRSISNDDNDEWLKPAFAEMYRVLADDSFCVSFYGWLRKASARGKSGNNWKGNQTIRAPVPISLYNPWLGMNIKTEEAGNG